MITAVQTSNTNFNGLKSLKTQKIKRDIVKIKSGAPQRMLSDRNYIAGLSNTTSSNVDAESMYALASLTGGLAFLSAVRSFLAN